MLTEFGKFCRKLRIDRDEKLSDMAARLRVSSAFLSCVEHGKKPPASWRTRFPEEYQLTEELSKEFRRCYLIAMTPDKIDISSFSENDKQFLRTFIQAYPKMNEESLSIIRDLVPNPKEECVCENSNTYSRSF